MNLHTAGLRHGVVAAPHCSRGRGWPRHPAEGGNAIEAMLAMAASIAAVYPHMNHVGGDGFWLIREPSGRVRAIMGAGRAGAQSDAAILSRRAASRNPGARAARRAHRAGCGRWLDAGARGGQGERRPAAARCSARRRHQACARGLHGRRAARRGSRSKNTPSWKRRPDFIDAFLVDGKAPEAGAGSSRANSPTRSNTSPTPGSTTSIAAMSAARSPPIWSASAAR